MLPVRRSIARVWSGSAITWWTWLVTLPSALTVMSGLQYVTGGPAAVLAVAALQHAILGGLLLVGAAVLRVVRGRGRPFAVFTIYAVVGAARPLLFLEAGGLLGIRVMAGDLIGRMAINLVVVVVMFSLIAIGVDLVREHRGMFRRLRAAQHASERDVECAADRLRRLRSTAVDEVVSALEDAATTATAHRLEPVEAARVLRTLAEDVVRPASHRIYDDDSAGGPPEARGLSRGEWAASVIGGMRAAPPITAAVLFTALVLPFALVQIGAVSLLPVVTGLLVLLVAGAGVAAIPLPQRAVPRALLLLVLYSVVGVVLAVTTGLALTLVGENPSSAWFEALTYPLITLGVAFVTSLTIRVRQDQAELERALQSRVGAAARIRSEYDRERASLARLLHAGVQSELIAGALALTSTRAVGPETPRRAPCGGRGPRSGRAARGARRNRTLPTRSGRSSRAGRRRSTSVHESRTACGIGWAIRPGLRRGRRRLGGAGERGPARRRFARERRVAAARRRRSGGRDRVRRDAGTLRDRGSVCDSSQNAERSPSERSPGVSNWLSTSPDRSLRTRSYQPYREALRGHCIPRFSRDGACRRPGPGWGPLRDPNTQDEPPAGIYSSALMEHPGEIG